ncbi:MAG: iron ABC transporter permease, partial [Mycolicibacterium sp.]
MVSREPTTALGVLLLLLFGWLIAAPVLNLLNDAIRVQYADQARTGQAFGELTTYYFERVFLSPASHKLFWAPL